MSAFVTGWCLMAAITFGLKWLDDRNAFCAFAFWLNLTLTAINAYFWWAA